MFDFDKITDSIAEAKELAKKHLPEVKAKFEELQNTALDVAETMSADLQFVAFMNIAPFFFQTVATSEKDEAGNVLVKAKYMADKHANAFMACRKNFAAAMIVLAQEETDEETAGEGDEQNT